MTFCRQTWAKRAHSSISHIKLVPACKITIYTFPTVINNFPYGTTYKLMCQVILKMFPCLNNQLSYQRRISCMIILVWKLYFNSLLMDPWFKSIFLLNLLWSLTIKTNWSTDVKINFFALLNIDAVPSNSLSYYTAHSHIRFLKELYYHSWNFRYQHFQNWGWKPSINPMQAQ